MKPSPSTPSCEIFLLRSTQRHDDGTVTYHYFCRLGRRWPHDPRFRLIAKTVTRRQCAKKFRSYLHALLTLAETGDNPHWSIVPFSP